jgi:hypothetical protein
MSGSLVLLQKCNKCNIWKYQSRITLLLWKFCVLFQFQSSTPSDCLLCNAPFVQLQPRTGTCHSWSCQKGGITTMKYVSTLRGMMSLFTEGTSFLLTPPGAQAKGWADLCLHCVQPQFQSPPSLVPASVSSSSDTLTSMSISWPLYTSEPLSTENCLSVQVLLRFFCVAMMSKTEFTLLIYWVYPKIPKHSHCRMKDDIQRLQYLVCVCVWGGGVLVLYGCMFCFLEECVWERKILFYVATLKLT